jgi:DNA-binding NtrC family response regulator
MIVRTLDANRGNKNRTARQLGISRRSLYNKLERYQIAAPPRSL